MTTSLNRLTAAVNDERAAIKVAMDTGLNATKPLTAARLAQLCLLGERMMHTALRRSDAERDCSDQTIGMSGPVDILLPA